LLENRVLRGIFEPKRDEVTERYSKFNKEEVGMYARYWRESQKERGH
jgi:hypothetical protein